MNLRMRLVGSRTLVALLLATTAGLATGPADAKGLIPCISPGADVHASSYVSRASATLSNENLNTLVSAWISHTGAPRASVWISTASGYFYGSGALQEFSVQPALDRGRAVGTFEYYGRTFSVDLTLEGSGAPQLSQPDVWAGMGCYGYVYGDYQTGEVVRSATGTGTVSVSGIGAVTDDAAEGSVAHGVGLPPSR